MNAGATAAVIAAQAARRRREEEEEMTRYSAEDLAGGWEFKILRSGSNAFRKPERLRQYLDEEAAAGWTLVEKFDAGRVRLKRPVAARANDAALSLDPYRSCVGLSEGVLVMVWVGGLTLLFGTAALIISQVV